MRRICTVSVPEQLQQLQEPGWEPAQTDRCGLETGQSKLCSFPRVICGHDGKDKNDGVMLVKHQRVLNAQDREVPASAVGGWAGPDLGTYWA